MELLISNSNYKEAVDLLQKRYVKKQILISKYVETLLALPAIESSKDLQNLRCLYDRTEATVRNLRGVGVSDESRDLSDEWDIVGIAPVFVNSIVTQYFLYIFMLK